MIKFSVVLPVRNGGDYIKECVNSILQQTYPHFNLLILDNCSTDGTVDWLRSIANEKIIVYTSDTSLSIEQSWSRTAQIPRNEFITLIGHDDILYPDFLETIADLINMHPDAGLYHTHFNLIDADGKVLRPARSMPATLDGPGFIEIFLQSKLDVMGTGYVMRRDDYDKIGGIPLYPSLLFADFELWMELIGKRYEAISPKICFAFRKHLSTTTGSKDEIYLKAFDRFCSYLLSKMQEQPNLKQYIQTNITTFLRINLVSISHRLLRTSIDKRAGISANYLERKFLDYAVMFGVEQQFTPGKYFKFVVAKRIDANPFLRGLFLLFKKIYRKPFAA